MNVSVKCNFHYFFYDFSTFGVECR
uniref:Uncharacterized protein n=1 Tax=Anguilla anguilla TaxID=7936 RepID=A0A0E9T102_ANGAN